MSIESRTIANLKGQLSKFSGIISKRFKKPKHRLIKEMLYGIQASKDVKLSNIARTLKEDLAFIKTEDRLSRNLDDVDFTDGINDEIVRLAAPKITDAVSYFAAVYLGQSIKLKFLVERIYLVSKRFFGVPSFFNYAVADGIFNLLYPDKTALKGKTNNIVDFQLCFEFG